MLFESKGLSIVILPLIEKLMFGNAKLCILTLVLFSVVLFLPKLVNAAPNERGYDYQLYKNYENFGVLVFPKDLIFKVIKKIGREIN